jgi:hypothetical protein
MRSYLAKQLNNTQVIFIIIMRRPSQTGKLGAWATDKVLRHGCPSEKEHMGRTESRFSTSSLEMMKKQG